MGEPEQESNKLTSAMIREMANKIAEHSSPPNVFYLDTKALQSWYLMAPLLREDQQVWLLIYLDALTQKSVSEKKGVF